MPDRPESRPWQDLQEPIEGVDFYREGPYVVFTEVFHLRRGYCCNSGCRHCPWRAEREEKSIPAAPE